MTETELEEIEARLAPDIENGGRAATDTVETLIAEVRRLRGLIKDAEWADTAAGEVESCPWCGGAAKGGKAWGLYEGHKPGCPAFSALGVMR